MSNKKMVTKTSLRKALRSITSDRVIQINVRVGDENICIDVKRYLTSQEEISCIASIIDSVMIDGEYKPEVIEVAYMMNYLMAYTNIDISVGVEDVYRLKYETDLFEKCFDISGFSQWEKICSQAQNAIKYKNDSVLFGAKKELDLLIGKIEQITDSLNSVSESFRDVDSSAVEKAINRLATMDDKKIIELITTSKDK